MSTLAVERIKLFSTRSPWWCMVLAAILPIGFGVLVTVSSDPAYEPQIFFTMAGMQFALSVIMVMAAVAVTSEYRFGTIRTTFQAMPNRAAVLWTKAGVLGGLSLLLGEVIAFSTYGVARLVAPTGTLALETAADWRMVAGHGVVYGLAAMIAVGVGALVRQTAGAVTILLVWGLVLENLIGLLPGVGQDVQRYLPFVNATLFAADKEVTGVLDPLGPVASLGIFAATAVVVMVAATVVVRRRDA